MIFQVPSSRWTDTFCCLFIKESFVAPFPPSPVLKSAQSLVSAQTSCSSKREKHQSFLQWTPVYFVYSYFMEDWEDEFVLVDAHDTQKSSEEPSDSPRASTARFAILLPPFRKVSPFYSVIHRDSDLTILLSQKTRSRAHYTSVKLRQLTLPLRSNLVEFIVVITPKCVLEIASSTKTRKHKPSVAG